MNHKSITAALALAMRLGDVKRATRTPDGRREDDATHTVSLALIVIEHYEELCEAAHRRLNQLRLLIYAVAHDLVEAHAGDVFTAVALSDEARAAKDAAEAAALERIRLDFPVIAAYIDAYEQRADAESAVIHMLDKMMPKAAAVLNDGVHAFALDLSIRDVMRSHADQRRKLAAAHDGLLINTFDAICDAAEEAYVKGSHAGFMHRLMAASPIPAVAGALGATATLVSIGEGDGSFTYLAKLTRGQRVAGVVFDESSALSWRPWRPQTGEMRPVSELAIFMVGDGAD